MKKIISITVFTLICGLLFTSCGGGGNSPSSVVKKALNAHKQKNADALSKYFYDLSDSDKKFMRRYYFEEEFDFDDCVRRNHRYASDSEVESRCKEQQKDFEKYKNGIEIVKFEIQDERIFDNGEKAEVIVKIFYRDGEEHTEKKQLIKTSSGWKFEQYRVRGFDRL